MSLINTRLQNMRAAGNLDKWEIRASRYGALDLFMRQTESPTGIITEDLKSKAKVSIGSTLEVPAIDDNTALTIGSTRDVVIVDAENTSRMIVISFATYSHGFTIVPSLFHNNEISMQRDFETKMKLTDRLFAKALDAVALSTLESNKTKVYSDTLLFTELADVIVAKFAQREDILGDSNVMMAANDFFGELHVVANGGFESLVRDLAEKDLFNSENKRMEYNDKVWYWDNALVNGAGKFGTAFVVQEDSVGMLFRHEREAILETKMEDGTEWNVDMLPIGVPVSTYFYESRGDFNAIAGAASADMTRVKKDHFGFAIDVAFQASFISDTANRATPISKIQINRSETDSDVTAPLKSSISAITLLTNFTITFTEVMCTDQAGTVIAGDIKDLFTITAAAPTGVAITSAIASADGLSVVFIIADPSTNLAAEDYVESNAASLWDGAGNAHVSDQLADVNVGGTAWELAD